MNSDTLIAVILLLAFSVGMLSISYHFYKKSKAAKEAMQLTAERFGATISGSLKHISGLPIAKGAVVDVYYGPEKIVFKKDGQEIVVLRSKVTDVDLVISGNTSRKAFSGAAMGKRAIGGNMGATIGALSALVPNLVISYSSNGKSRSITLDTSTGGTFASKVQKDFRQTAPKNRTTIEL